MVAGTVIEVLRFFIEVLRRSDNPALNHALIIGFNTFITNAAIHEKRRVAFLLMFRVAIYWNVRGTLDGYEEPVSAVSEAMRWALAMTEKVMVVAGTVGRILASTT